MRPIDFQLGAADTMTIRRVIKPARVTNKGKAVFRMETSLGPVLKENGWEFVSQNQKDRSCSYFRSPNNIVAETFIIHASIPTDEAILRLVVEFKKVVSLPLGPGEGFQYEARLAPYTRACFYPHGDFYYYHWDDPEDAPKGTKWQWNMPPALSVGIPHLWTTYLFWPFGFCTPPVWQQHDTYSGLMPDLDYRGWPIIAKQDGGDAKMAY